MLVFKQFHTKEEPANASRSMESSWDGATTILPVPNAVIFFVSHGKWLVLRNESRHRAHRSKKLAPGESFVSVHLNSRFSD